MKSQYLLFLSLLLAVQLNAVAQVKIGDNPGIIDASSLLEMESTSKGVLFPRMTESQRDGITDPATSLNIFNTSTGLFNYYNGTAWIEMKTEVRDNHVLVKIGADFPAVAGGVITLDANTVYEINGSITLSDKIDLNNAKIYGLDVFEDKLIYTGTGELFTGTKGGTVRNLQLTSSTAGAQVFNLVDVGQTELILIMDCLFTSSKKAGTFEGYLSVAMLVNAFMYNDDGFSFKNVSHLLLTNMNFFMTNKGIMIELVDGSTFDFIGVNGGFYHVTAANLATGINFGTGVTVTHGGHIKTNLHGDGTRITGTPSNDWEINSNGIDTQTDDVATGNLYVTTTVTTSIPAKNTKVKLAGTTSSLNLFRVTSTTNNRLTYTGSKTRYFSYIASISMTASNNGKRFVFYMAKNGATLPESAQSRKIANGADRGALSISGVIELATNDYLEVWVENISDATNVTAESMNMHIK